MRFISRHWLLALILGCATALSLGVSGCSKDEDAAAQGDEDSAKSAATAASSEEEQDEEEKTEEGDEAAEDEAEDPAGDKAELETPPAKPDDTSKRIVGDTADGNAAPRGDKARDRVKAAREEAASPPTPEAAEAGAAESAATKPGEGEAAATAPGSTGLLSPAERRKVERERRIAELKRRNEERRQARMAKVDDQRRESEAEAAVKRENASVEARAPAPAAPRGMPLKKYITQSDVRKLLSNDTLVEEGGLSGITPSEAYNSVYFAPPVRSTFGVAVQVWRDKTRRDANVRFRRMRAQYANAEDTTAPTAKSFISQWDEILTLSFANLTKRVVVSVSCSVTICKPAQLLSVAKAISAKL